MANWSDPQSGATSFATATGARTEAFDAGLRRYMLSVYNYMFSGILLTGIVAMGFAASGMAAQVFGGPGILKWIITLAPLGFVFGMSFGGGRMSAGTLQAMFWGFAVAMGLSLSTIFLAYTGTSIAQSFFATAAAFGGLSLFGYTTKKDMTAMGSFLIMGVIGLVVASIVNLFLQSGTFYLIISGLGVLIFSGLIAYDTQRLKMTYYELGGNQTAMGVATNYGALSLYINFINLFQFLLAIFGNRR